MSQPDTHEGPALEQGDLHLPAREFECLDRPIVISPAQIYAYALSAGLRALEMTYQPRGKSEGALHHES